MAKDWQDWKGTDFFTQPLDTIVRRGVGVGWRDYSSDEFGDIVAAYHFASKISTVGFFLSDLPKILGPSGVQYLDASAEMGEYNIYWSDVEFVLDVGNIMDSGDLALTLPGLSDSAIIHIDTTGRYVVSIGSMPLCDTFLISFNASSVDFEVDAWGIHSLVVVPSYVCGDADASEGVDIDDVVYLINYIFLSGPEPSPFESGDADCSGAVDIDDVVWLIAYIFSEGKAPCDTDGDEVPDC
jgi:hypothetical protein